MNLPILYQDDHLVIVNKPNGALVHRTSMAADAEEYVLQELRNLIGRKVNPVHRLDRKTSGVLMFAFDREITTVLQSQFLSNEVSKEYIAIVRGYFPDKTILDYPLTNDRGKTQEAITSFENIEHSEIPISSGKFETSRYSLIKAIPTTGRYHQIRKHLAHLRHPIIGDRPHGCNKQNRFFKTQWDMTKMLLHARTLTFRHPITQEKIAIEADFPTPFYEMIDTLRFERDLQSL